LIKQMNYDELSVMHKAMTVQYPEWRGVSDVMAGITKKLNKGTTGTTSNSTTPDSCSDAYLADPSFSDLAATRAAEIGFMAAYEAVPEPDNAPILTLLFLPSATGALALETLNSIYDRCSGDDAIAEVKAKIDTVEGRVSEVGASIRENDDDNTGLILREIGDAVDEVKTDIINNNNANTLILNTNINDTRTAVIANDNTNTTNIVNNDNTNTTNITNNDNANRTLIINNDNANAGALTDLMLRTQIEADLAEADNASFVGWYVMPTAQGGHADFVRFIVVDTITKLAGSNTVKANGFLAQADAAASAGNRKTAYQLLRKAYKAAVGD